MPPASTLKQMHTHSSNTPHPPGDETTRAGWEYAVIVDIDEDEIYQIIWDFNEEDVCGGHRTHTYSPPDHPLHTGLSASRENSHTSSWQRLTA